MLNYNELSEIIIDSSKQSKTSIKRKKEEELEDALLDIKPITVITGIRRCGKSFLLKNLYHKLLKNNIPKQNILFLNFEDDRLNEYLNVRDLRNIYQLFLSNADENKTIYLFFDEIQNIPHWEKFVRTIYDSTNHQIYISGSNAQLLSREFASALGGRLIEYNLYPFSFKEILELNKVNYKNAFDRAENKSKIDKLLQKYIDFGGLPETFKLPDRNKMLYRKSLIDKIVINDILKRFNLHSVGLLSDILYFLEKNAGKIISYRNIAKAAKTNENTVESYIAYLNTAFIVEKLKKFSWKTKAVFDKNKKFYFVDNLFCANADIEKKLENICYVHLMQHYEKEQIFLGRDDHGKEIDFIVRTSNKIRAIQVCYELTDDNFNREVSSLQLLNKHIDSVEKELIILLMYNNLQSKKLPENIRTVHIKEFLLEE